MDVLKRTTIGGQALIEGVMMKNQHQYATAVRKPDGEIDIQVTDYVSFGERYHLQKIPIIRGCISFVESMVIGMKTLTYSSQFFEDEEETTKKAQKDTNENIMILGAVIVSLLLSFGLFMVLPNVITNFLRNYTKNEFLFALVEGGIRLAIFLAYVFFISLMEDIKRVFMYHGAEHKTINCLEHGEELTPENVLKYSRLHKRCGTSFMLIVMVISILFFMFIRVDDKLLRLVLRLLLIPVISGVSYEFIRLAGKRDTALINLLSKPGMWLQKLTTREPDEKMIEVAIASVEAVMDWRSYQEAMRNGEIEEE